MERIDIAIIGAGPGGISAAITARVRNKNAVLFDKAGLSPKVEKAALIRNYPGLPDISGEDLAKALRRHLELMEVPVKKEQVAAVYAMGTYFALQGATGMYEAKSVVLSAGVMQEKPLPGEEEYLGRGVSYCATCDAFLYKGKTVAVLAWAEDAAEEALFLSETAAKVLYFPAKAGVEVPEAKNITVINEKPKAIKGGLKAGAVEAGGRDYEADGIFVLRSAVAPDRLVPGLKTKGGHVATDLTMSTNIPGLFVCGDITGPPYQYIKAAGQGNTAALSAVSYLAKLKQA